MAVSISNCYKRWSPSLDANNPHSVSLFFLSDATLLQLSKRPLSLEATSLALSLALSFKATSLETITLSAEKTEKRESVCVRARVWVTLVQMVFPKGQSGRRKLRVDAKAASRFVMAAMNSSASLPLLLLLLLSLRWWLLLYWFLVVFLNDDEMRKRRRIVVVVVGKRLESYTCRRRSSWNAEESKGKVGNNTKRYIRATGLCLEIQVTQTAYKNNYTNIIHILILSLTGGLFS